MNMLYITPNDEKCRMVKTDLRHYIKTLVAAFKTSGRTPHTYAILNINNKKILKLVNFEVSIKATLETLENFTKQDNFITFVGFEIIRKLK